jgi:hypothetical protein
MCSRYARTATTDITLTPARLTATTDLAGLRVDCLSALARGMAGVGVGAAEAGAAEAMVVGVTVDTASSVGAVTPVDAVTAVGEVMPLGEALTVVAALHAVQVAGSTVAAASHAVQVEDSTAVAVDTAEAADMVAVDTGNRGVMQSLIR